MQVILENPRLSTMSLLSALIDRAEFSRVTTITKKSAGLRCHVLWGGSPAQPDGLHEMATTPVVNVAFTTGFTSTVTTPRSVW